ncbi:hypothetical protein B0H21DRAFT_718945 [Amylocystis lapponica]|nr:hypothetical protein B0H21DRAFT_718945 [Amylocystis lapponica]
MQLGIDSAMDQPPTSPHSQALPAVEQSSTSLADTKASAKPPVVRGARACTVCRQAKMKCVGADDGNNIPCQRCKRSGAECIFEKHRRGRKPGSRLSEASKMLRRLEKGLHTAKQKSHVNDISLTPPEARISDSQFRNGDSYSGSSSRFPNNELPPLQLPPHLQEDYSRTGRTSPQPDSEMDEDGDETDRYESGMYPARLIRKENQRNTSYFKTILNPDQVDPKASRPVSSSGRSYSQAHSQSPQLSSQLPNSSTTVSSIYNGSPLKDPVAAGLIDLKEAQDLFDLFYIRLNAFINLFDPALHSFNYVRGRCPFLFTSMLMAGCKFFKPELYVSVQRLAHEFGVRAFAENWKRVEVVQAFMCLTYWKEPDDTRTFTYIGYACRMAVELGLNRYVGKRVLNESDFEMRERRNRERTYLVLFVHDRSLSMQTGKHWMLPEDPLVQSASTWHEEGGSPIRPEDVVLASFVQLRRIAADTMETLHVHQGVPGSHHGEPDHEMLLRGCNSKLNQWVETWQREMQRAHGEVFHFSFLRCFQCYVRLFLNSFGVNTSTSPSEKGYSDVQALNACYTSAMDHLQCVAKDFASMGVLRYGQDSVTVMTAYSAIFLLRLLRSSSTLSELKEGAAREIYAMIRKTADAYAEAAHLSPSTSAAAYHSRFLLKLVENDIQRTEQADQEKYKQSLASTRRGSVSKPIHGQMPQGYQSSQMYAQPSLPSTIVDHTNSFNYSAPPSIATPSSLAQGSAGSFSYSRGESDYHPISPESATRSSSLSAYVYPAVGSSAPFTQQYSTAPMSEGDAVYWSTMFKDTGFPDTAEQSYVYQSGSLADAIPASSSGYTVSYREAHANDHVYSSHQYQYPTTMNAYPASNFSSR